MKSKNQMLQAIGKKVSGRFVGITAIVAAAALVVTCVSTTMRSVVIDDPNGGVNVEVLSTDSGSILGASGMGLSAQASELAEWNFKTANPEIISMFNVSVSVDGVVRTVAIESGTVKDALDKAGVELGEHDVVNMSVDTVITESTSLTVDRVTIEERIETETIAYESTSYETDSYDKGETVVETNGVNGEKTKVYHDRYVNGELVESTLEEEYTSVEPVTEVIAVGTYVEPVVETPSVDIPATDDSTESEDDSQTTGGSTADFTYSAVYYGKGTAYTNENGLCGEYTASGMKAQVGVVAVNPNVIPYGTRLYITTADGSYTYGYCVAGDTGGFIYTHPDTIVDLFFDTAAECYQFGRRDVIVYVLD